MSTIQPGRVNTPPAHQAPNPAAPVPRTEPSEAFAPGRGEVITDLDRIRQLKQQLESQPDAHIVVSACLAGFNVRYDGGNCNTDNLRTLVESGKAIPVCAEVLGGLSTPRTPSEIQGGDGLQVLQGKARVETKLGQDITDNFTRGADIALKTALQAAAGGQILFAVLKSKSPSCGVGSIYDGGFAGGLKPGDGIATTRFRDAGIDVISSDNWRLATEGEN
ncbi:DUF523 domain-containing protein [bacterium]|nr:DUF523 domain-containing protein [bacterium]